MSQEFVIYTGLYPPMDEFAANHRFFRPWWPRLVCLYPSPTGIM